MAHTVRFPAKNLPLQFPKKLEDMIRTLKELGKMPELAADTETTGLHWHLPDFRPFYITFCDGVRAVGIPWPKQGSPVWRAMKEEIFDNESQIHVYQNAKFDLLGMATQGIFDKGKVHDTMILKALHDERDPKNLEAMAKKYLEEGVAKMTEPVEKWFKDNGVLKGDRRYDALPEEILAPYAAQDTVVTWFLWKGLHPLVMENEHWRTCYEKVELPCLAALVDVERAGYLMDVKMLKALEPELDAQAMELESKARELISMAVDVGGVASCEYASAFNFQSPEQKVDLFLSKLGVSRSVLGTTDKMAPSVDQYALDRIVLKYANAEDVRLGWASKIAALTKEFLEKRKLVDTFVKGLDRYTAADGVLHGKFNQVGAGTGRMSSSDPNLQNIPVDGPIRAGFVCRPGMVNFFFDWKQIEMVVLAHYSEDPTMVEALKAGVDLHKATAALLFDKAVEEVTKDERTIAKTINFAICYGAGQARVAEQIGWELQRAKELLTKYNQRFPGVKAFRDRAGSVVKKRGYVRTYFGRYRHLDPDKSYVAVNSIVQGTATGDMIKLATARVVGYLKGEGGKGRVISVVHDDVHAELPLEGYKPLVEGIVRIMEDWPEFIVPVRVDVSWSKTNWADKKPWDGE